MSGRAAAPLDLAEVRPGALLVARGSGNVWRVADVDGGGVRLEAANPGASWGGARTLYRRLDRLTAWQLLRAAPTAN